MESHVDSQIHASLPSLVSRSHPSKCVTLEYIDFVFTAKSEDIDILTLATMFALVKCQTR